MLDRSGYVYVIQDGTGLCKIGRAKDVQKRIRSLSTGSSSELRLVVAWACENADDREAELHTTWSDVRVRGEWFRIPDDVVAAWRTENVVSISEPRTRGLRSVSAPTPRADTGWTPLPGKDGVWWISKHGQEIECPKCGEEYEDRPGVMFYLKVKDWGGLMQLTHPNWPRDGWAIWREHDRCGWHDWKSETATTRQLQSWGVGPWRHMYRHDD